MDAHLRDPKIPSERNLRKLYHKFSIPSYWDFFNKTIISFEESRLESDKYPYDFQFIFDLILSVKGIHIFCAFCFAIFFTILGVSASQMLYIPLAKYIGIRQKDFVKFQESLWKLLYNSVLWSMTYYHLISIYNTFLRLPSKITFTKMVSEVKKTLFTLPLLIPSIKRRVRDTHFDADSPSENLRVTPNDRTEGPFISISKSPINTELPFQTHETEPNVRSYHFIFPHDLGGVLRGMVRTHFTHINNTITDTLQTLVEHTNIPAKSLILSYNGEILSAYRPFSSYHIPSGSFVNVFFTLKGGADNKPTENKSPHTCSFFLDENHSPATWLLIMESFFSPITSMTSKDKYCAVLALLPVPTLSKLTTAVAKAATSQTPYEDVKEALLGLHKEPKASVFDRYFKTQSLGDQKPSKFLDTCIQELGALQIDTSTDEDLLKRFFLSALPTQTQAILAVSSTKDLKELASMADKIAEVIKPQLVARPVTPVTSETSPAPNTNTQTLILNALEKLNSNITQFNTGRQRNNSRGRTNQGSDKPFRKQSSSRNSPSRAREVLCYFHLKFGREARLCNLGCVWRDRRSDCKILQTCVHHAKYKEAARTCVQGCTFTASKIPPNQQKN